MTLGQLLRAYAGQLLDRHPQAPGVARVLRSLAACRTPSLGGHATRCDHCGDVAYHYHSCGNRHCPQCGGIKRAAWLAQRQAELLDVPYFHLVFTLPHELSALVLGNRQVLYKLLFAASAQTLMQVAADPKHLGARLGALAVLHTWGQKLEHHPHVHMVVPGGGLACNKKGVALKPWRWLSSRPKFLLPVKVLSKVYRGKFLAGLRQAYDTGQLQFGGSTAALAARPAFQKLLSTLYAKDWVVYAKKPFAGPAVLLKYLARYTHRVALDNRRLVKLSDNEVSLTYKDYADGCALKKMTLAAVELLRRFALHIVPVGFVRIRHFGLLTHRDRGQRLAQCRALLGQRTSGNAAVSAAPAGEAAVSPTAPAAALPAAAAAPRPASATAPSLAPILLVAALASPAPADSTSQLTLPTAIATPEGICRVCRQGRPETFWRAERPRGRDFELAWSWNTS